MQHVFSVSALACFNPSCLSVDLEPGHEDLRAAVDAIVSEALGRCSISPPYREESESHGSLVHCGRTKAFLTQYMVRCGSDTPSSPILCVDLMYTPSPF